jgi:hypothetical protein
MELSKLLVGFLVTTLETRFQRPALKTLTLLRLQINAYFNFVYSHCKNYYKQKITICISSPLSVSAKYHSIFLHKRYIIMHLLPNNGLNSSNNNFENLFQRRRSIIRRCKAKSDLYRGVFMVTFNL